MAVAGYKRATGIADEYWYCLVDGVERKYSRMIAGAALPIFDRMQGALIVLGEAYRPGGVPDFTMLDARVGDWNEVENAISQFRKDLKFSRIIVQTEQQTDFCQRRIKALRFATGEIPCLAYAAPSYACTEIGRNDVNQLAEEGRLHVSTELLRELDKEKELAKVAMCCAIEWCRENEAIYSPIRRGHRGFGAIIGTQGL